MGIREQEKQEEERRKAGRIGRREDNEQEANESEVKEDVFVYEQEKGLVLKKKERKIKKINGKPRHK